MRSPCAGKTRKVPAGSELVKMREGADRERVRGQPPLLHAHVHLPLGAPRETGEGGERPSSDAESGELGEAPKKGGMASEQQRIREETSRRRKARAEARCGIVAREGVLEKPPASGPSLPARGRAGPVPPSCSAPSPHHARGPHLHSGRCTCFSCLCTFVYEASSQRYHHL